MQQVTIQNYLIQQEFKVSMQGTSDILKYCGFENKSVKTKSNSFSFCSLYLEMNVLGKQEKTWPTTRHSPAGLGCCARVALSVSNTTSFRHHHLTKGRLRA